MRSKAEYKAAFKIVRRVITNWDPYALIAGGAPANEFDHEAALITARVPNILSAESAATQLSQVFSAQFEPHLFGVEACMAIGTELFEELLSAGIVGTEAEG